jgi:CII-binding regulator of phage lambda lysogenization HflD
LKNQEIQQQQEELQSNSEEIIKEREKILSLCLNLECKKEQLKILIKKLQSIANQRETFLSNKEDKLFSNELNNIYRNVISPKEEIKCAKTKFLVLDKQIGELKEKIVGINKMLG